MDAIHINVCSMNPRKKDTPLRHPAPAPRLPRAAEKRPVEALDLIGLRPDTEDKYEAKMSDDHDDVSDDMARRTI